MSIVRSHTKISFANFNRSMSISFTRKTQMRLKSDGNANAISTSRSHLNQTSLSRLKVRIQMQIQNRLPGFQMQGGEPATNWSRSKFLNTCEARSPITVWTLCPFLFRIIIILNLRLISNNMSSVLELQADLVTVLLFLHWVSWSLESLRQIASASSTRIVLEAQQAVDRLFVRPKRSLPSIAFDSVIISFGWVQVEMNAKISSVGKGNAGVLQRAAPLIIKEVFWVAMLFWLHTIWSLLRWMRLTLDVLIDLFT